MADMCQDRLRSLPIRDVSTPALLLSSRGPSAAQLPASWPSSAALRSGSQPLLIVRS